MSDEDPRILARAIADAMPRAHYVGSVLTLAEAAILLFVAKQDASVAEIEEGLGLSVASTSDTTAGLVARGLMTKVRNRFDHRKTTCALTAKGIRLLRSANVPTQTKDGV